MYTNVAYTWQPKFVSPFGDKEVYLVPRVNDQKGDDYNYIVVCCSPSYNGLYKWPSKEAKNLKKFNNHGKWCYYVPFKICEFVKPLSEVQTKSNQEKIEQVQEAWYNYTKPKKLPSWFITYLLK